MSDYKFFEYDDKLGGDISNFDNKNKRLSNKLDVVEDSTDFSILRSNNESSSEIVKAADEETTFTKYYNSAMVGKTLDDLEEAAQSNDDKNIVKQPKETNICRKSKVLLESKSEEESTSDDELEQTMKRLMLSNECAIRGYIPETENLTQNESKILFHENESCTNDISNVMISQNVSEDEDEDNDFETETLDMINCLEMNDKETCGVAEETLFFEDQESIERNDAAMNSIFDNKDSEYNDGIEGNSKNDDLNLNKDLDDVGKGRSCLQIDAKQVDIATKDDLLYTDQESRKRFNATKTNLSVARDFNERDHSLHASKLNLAATRSGSSSHDTIQQECKGFNYEVSVKSREIVDSVQSNATQIDRISDTNLTDLIEDKIKDDMINKVAVQSDTLPLKLDQMNYAKFIDETDNSKNKKMIPWWTSPLIIGDESNENVHKAVNDAKVSLGKGCQEIMIEIDDVEDEKTINAKKMLSKVESSNKINALEETRLSQNKLLSLTEITTDVGISENGLDSTLTKVEKSNNSNNNSWWIQNVDNSIEEYPEIKIEECKTKTIYLEMANNDHKINLPVKENDIIKLNYPKNSPSMADMGNMKNGKEEHNLKLSTGTKYVSKQKLLPVTFRKPYHVCTPPLPSRSIESIMRDHTESMDELDPQKIPPKTQQLRDLISAAKDVSITRRSNACGALKVMVTKGKKIQILLARTIGLIESLLYALDHVLDTKDPENSKNARERASFVLKMLTSLKQNRQIIFRQIGLPECLVKVIAENVGEIRLNSCIALAYLAKSEKNKILMAKVVGLVTTLSLVMVGEKKTILENTVTVDISKKQEKRNEKCSLDERPKHDPEISKKKEDNDPSPNSLLLESSSDKYELSGTELNSDIICQSTKANNKKNAVDVNLNSVSKESKGVESISSYLEQNLLSTRMNACATLLHLSKNCLVTMDLCNNEDFLNAIILISQDFYNPIHTKCLEICCNMTRLQHNNTKLALRTDLIETLIKCSKSKLEEDRSWSMRIFQNLTASSCNIMAKLSIVEQLCVSSMRKTTEQEAAVSALLNLSSESKNVVPLTSAKNVMACLIFLAQNPNSLERVSSTSCHALAQIAMWLQSVAAGVTVPEEINPVPLPSSSSMGWMRWDK